MPQTKSRYDGKKQARAPNQYLAKEKKGAATVSDDDTKVSRFTT